jgi:hypothetical protein
MLGPTSLGCGRCCSPLYVYGPLGRSYTHPGGRALLEDGHAGAPRSSPTGLSICGLTSPALRRPYSWFALARCATSRSTQPFAVSSLSIKLSKLLARRSMTGDVSNLPMYGFCPCSTGDGATTPIRPCIEPRPPAPRALGENPLTAFLSIQPRWSLSGSLRDLL